MNATLQHPEARRRVTAARTALVLDEPFFGTLALKLKLVEEPNCGCPDLRTCPHTAWVDGQSLGYWPRFVMSLTHVQLTALLVHEVMHCAAGHPWRRDNREPRKWNQAADRAINPVLREAGYTLPPDGLFELEPSHHGKSAEWIYDRLPRADQQSDEQRPGSGSGSGSSQADPQQGPNDKAKAAQGPPNQGRDQGTQGKPGKGASGAGRPQDKRGQQTQGNTPPNTRSSGLGQGAKNEGPDKDHKSDIDSQGKGNVCDPLGEVRDAPTESADPDEALPTEEDWKQAVQQAAVLAKGQGNMPGALKRFAKMAATSSIDWRSAMRRFAQEVARSDYSFSRPNVRYVASGTYLPSLRNHEVGVLAIGVDTSGSIDQVLLDQFASEVRAVADAVKPRQIRVLYVDAKVQHEDVFERDEEVVLRPKGGGGTDFCPFFEAIAEWEDPPVAAIYLTDLLGTFPDEEPHTPTLWVTGNEKPRPVPFGEVVTAD